MLIDGLKRLRFRLACLLLEAWMLLKRGLRKNNFERGGFSSVKLLERGGFLSVEAS